MAFTVRPPRKEEKTETCHAEHQRLVATLRFFPRRVKCMRHVWKRLVFLLVVFSPGAALAQGVSQHPLVRFTGVLLPVEEKGRSCVHTHTVRITDTTWICRIAKVENLTGRDLRELGLFQALFPPRVHFVGSEDLLRPLQESEITGRRLRIEGHLYTADRALWVTAVEEVAGK